jgi:hypothetical protein
MPKKGTYRRTDYWRAEAVRKRRKSGGDLPETRRQPGHRRAVSRRQRRLGTWWPRPGDGGSPRGIRARFAPPTDEWGSSNYR